jgi:hypothetical protein
MYSHTSSPSAVTSKSRPDAPSLINALPFQSGCAFEMIGLKKATGVSPHRTRQPDPSSGQSRSRANRAAARGGREGQHHQVRVAQCQTASFHGSGKGRDDSQVHAAPAEKPPAVAPLIPYASVAETNRTAPHGSIQRPIQRPTYRPKRVCHGAYPPYGTPATLRARAGSGHQQLTTWPENWRFCQYHRPGQPDRPRSSAPVPT